MRVHTGTCQDRASAPAEPEWSGWMWVNTIAAGRVSGPNTASAAVLIASALLAQPASTSRPRRVGADQVDVGGRRAPADGDQVHA
jgi:hypothetical protein